MTLLFTVAHFTIIFEPIIQVLDFVNKLYSSKFQVPGPGALVEGAGELSLTSRELPHDSIGVDAQEQFVGFEPTPCISWCLVVGRKKHNRDSNLKPTSLCQVVSLAAKPLLVV